MCVREGTAVRSRLNGIWPTPLSRWIVREIRVSILVVCNWLVENRFNSVHNIVEVPYEKSETRVSLAPDTRKHRHISAYSHDSIPV